MYQLTGLSDLSMTESHFNTHIFHANLIQSFGDLDFLRGVEVSTRELLAFAQGAVCDLEIQQIAQG